ADLRACESGQRRRHSGPHLPPAHRVTSDHAVLDRLVDPGDDLIQPLIERGGRLGAEDVPGLLRAGNAPQNIVFGGLSWTRRSRPQRPPGPPAAPGAAAAAHVDENETITVPEVKDRQTVRDPRPSHCA